ncbi:TRAP transporter substrate-binding protein [Candidimonas nitroreducens]|uniref:ABC transporter substrate-binding protein n=1 Tax=Candidimonas nitroreducens TaxID=683354 RepID=A0A225M8B7_9BURK|nr:TRAP transporter substrate-binding protein [Candidimonas nitroreducens]OWT57584.1 ABC transporter substrate-binding protein [Candidimonas nitroreducens]
MTTTTSRRAFLTSVAAAPLASIPFISHAKPAERIFKLAHPLAADHPTNIRLQQAADRIAKQSDGRLQLRLFPNNQLGGEVDLLNQVRSGAVEMFVVGGLIASSVVPMAALDGVGFAFKDSASVMKGMDGALGTLIRSALTRANLYAPSVIWDYGFREITSSSRVIKTVADISGMKIRVPGAAAYVDLFKALGAAPTSIQFNEVYPALQTKIVDGQENPLGVIVTSKFYEVQSFCALSNHIWQGNWVLINGRAWRGLSADLQEIMEKNLNESGLAQRQDLSKLEQSYKDTIVKGGVKINDIDTDSFRKKLSSSGYYKNARAKFGDAAWKVLEQAAGRELA